MGTKHFNFDGNIGRITVTQPEIRTLYVSTSAVYDHGYTMYIDYVGTDHGEAEKALNTDLDESEVHAFVIPEGAINVWVGTRDELQLSDEDHDELVVSFEPQDDLQEYEL